MNTSQLMQAMRDPAGIPAHPGIFQTLMLVTWVLHIAFVLLTLGTAGVAIWAYLRKDTHSHWARLSEAMTQVAKVGVSLLIVLGVAPLLFTQVIYDPQWYASNVLSARWAIAFILTLIIAYCLWFYFYAKNHGHKASRLMAGLAGGAIGLFVLDGFIMHVLSYPTLFPQQWAEWYAPGGVVDTSGRYLHAYQLSRFAFIMSLSVPAAGLYLLLYADYLTQRQLPETDQTPSAGEVSEVFLIHSPAPEHMAYLPMVRQLGRRLALVGFVISAVLMLCWQLGQHPRPELLWHPLGWVIAAWCAGMAWWLRGLSRPAGQGVVAASAGIGLLGLLAVWREWIRVTHLAHQGYTIADYTVNVDWPSMSLFLLTLVGVGGLVGGYYLRLLYRAGLSTGTYTADRFTARLGTAAVAVMALWLIVFFAYGINIYVGNMFQ